MGSNDSFSRLFSDGEEDFDGVKKKSRLEEFAERYEGFTLERGNTASFWIELLEIIQEKYWRILDWIIRRLNL